MSTIEWIVAIVGGLTAPFVLAAIVGLFLPREHVATRTVALKQSPPTVWQAITSFERIPAWWPPCVVVERLPDQDGRAVYKQSFQSGRRLQSITLEVVESVEPSRFVTRIADVKGPFQGRWVYELTAVDGGCRVALTEYGQIKNPLIRTMFRLAINKAQFIESYLVCLARKFGEQPLPR